MLISLDKFNEVRKNIVLSRKELLNDEMTEKRQEILNEMEVGMVLEGVVKNITYMAHVTIPSNSQNIYELIEGDIDKIDDENAIPKQFYKKTKIFINGNWAGCCDNPDNLYHKLKNAKYTGIINIYTSILEMRNRFII